MRHRLLDYVGKTTTPSGMGSRTACGEFQAMAGRRRRSSLRRKVNKSTVRVYYPAAGYCSQRGRRDRTVGLPSGPLVYITGNVLFARRFDATQMALIGGPVSVIEGIPRISRLETGEGQYTSRLREPSPTFVTTRLKISAGSCLSTGPERRHLSPFRPRHI